MKHIILLLAGLLMQSGVGAAELFRWVDDNGRVHYSDTPPAGEAQVARKKLSKGIEPEQEISYEAKRAQQNFPVTLYVGETCAEPCTLARGLLRKRGVPYSEKLLKTKTEID
ncbi:MAG: DUF4124 domain-containing protein, partial [Gallionella sp.]|nr:DUF4124 domain-containing protein [Gallionella sp.]